MRRTIVALAALLAVSPARAADRTLHLRVPPPVAENVAAMPLIAEPADDAEIRINTALQQLDRKVRKAIAGCKKEAGKNFDWSRAVDAPMRGPGFFSIVITDDVYCGGAHPSESIKAIVYDLRTGEPVDWTRLLPPSLTRKVELIRGADDADTASLSSPRLYMLFVAGYEATAADPECKDAIRRAGSGEPPGMEAWLDAKRDGLVLQIGLPHVFQACDDRVVLSVPTLRAEGARPALMDALEAARPR